VYQVHLFSVIPVIFFRVYLVQLFSAIAAPTAIPASVRSCEDGGLCGNIPTYDVYAFVNGVRSKCKKIGCQGNAAGRWP